MEIQEVEIIIDQDGEMQMAVRGVKGSHCLALTKQLEAALGGQIIARQMTGEALQARSAIKTQPSLKTCN